MALDNKRNNHSESQQYIYVQATIQKGTIPLLALLLQKRHPADFPSYDIETPEAPSGTLQIGIMGMALCSSALHRLADSKTETR